ncbi:hypothetical protein AVEN_102219-1 [Araneus ventricosus]|uniref:Uncharacterized protein n=1 Tax=Araneus ventricosus TaxID=182803 RepID=A0A4Y2TXF1_ARAVE|nr:hypothetical protein AVEN_102219-1 [Araneus ventricosus]
MCGPSQTPGNHYFQTQSATDCVEEAMSRLLNHNCDPRTQHSYSKIIVFCARLSGTCDNSQVPSHDSDGEEETETVFEQTYDGIENEEDRDESDNPIADDAEEMSVCDVSIDTEDDELATPEDQQSEKDCAKFQNYALHVD